MLRGLLARVQRPSCRILQAGASRIAWCPTYPTHVREYYRYCVDLFAQVLAQLDTPLDVVFGPYPVEFRGSRRCVRVDIQPEHTLVKPGGRDSANATLGAVPLLDESGHYLVRLANRDYLSTLHTAIEYSRPNLANLRSSGGFDEYLARVAVIAPLLYDFTPGNEQRDTAPITLIHDTSQPRRRRWLDAARVARLGLRNARGVFDASALARLYDRTGILVNLHQTDHHHTLEEFRVLPALLRGVVVVSEDVPLRETVPYHRSIVWSDYDCLVETVLDVQRNYARYRRELFVNTDLATVVRDMQEDNRTAAAAAVHRMAAV